MTTTTTPFKDVKKIGEGVYGMVIESKIGDSEDNVAIKINIKDTGVHGIGSLRETDLLSRIGDHPYIIDFKGVIIGEPHLDERPKALKDKNFEIDKIHFIMGREETTIEHIIKRRKYMSFKCIKTIFAQIVLGLDWIHSNGIIHRDIKPANILISGTDGNPRARICDFGLGTSLGGPYATTPGTITSWYRSPEVCLGRPYDEKADVWSAGSTVFELVSRRALLYGTNDENDDIIASIFMRLPTIASLSTIKKVNGGTISSKRSDLIHNEAKTFITRSDMTIDDRRKDVAIRLRQMLRLSATDVQNFADETNSTISEFCDVLSWMLSFDPTTRPSASQVLEHPFFDSLNTLKESISNSAVELPRVEINPCNERKAALCLLINLYNRRNDISWYSHRIVFHTIDTFDRYIAHMKNLGENISLTSDEVYLRVYTILYMFHKYFKTLSVPNMWRDFVPQDYVNEQSQNTSLEFEIFILRDVCRFRLHRDTVYEYLVHRDGRERESQCREYLIRLSRIEESWNDGSTRALIRWIDSKNQKPVI